jgi:hypothetical protein
VAWLHDIGSTQAHIAALQLGRHTVASGTPIEIAQRNLGPASLATRTIYVTTDRRWRMKAVGAFSRG